MVLWYAFGIGLVFAAPLARALSCLLRPVPNQWIHVAVFFAVPTLVFWVQAGSWRSRYPKSPVTARR